MTNADEPVNGTLNFQPLGNEYDGTTCVGQYTVGGLTKREYFAAMAMQGILSNPHGGDDRDGDLIARSSVAMADRLINELNKETTR